MIVLVAIYADLELYPPSLNAVRELAARTKHVYVVLRSLGHSDVELPDNVTLCTAVTRDGAEELRGMSAIGKLHDFLRYIRCLRAIRVNSKPCVLLAFDPLPLMAARISGIGCKTNVLWYHNHDKESCNPNRTFSLGWWAYATEASAFKRIDFFTVPARERLPLFATKHLETTPVLIPNYPSRSQVSGRVRSLEPDQLRLVYHGSLGRHHGFQEIIPWLGRQIGKTRLHLTLIGKIHSGFREELQSLARDSDVESYFEVRNFVPFAQLQACLEQFHIGLAIHKPIGITYSTGGTASNKIYEYAAAGLPVLLYDTAHFREHLGDRAWTAFCELDWKSFSVGLSQLIDGYQDRSAAAIADVRDRLNYETVFSEAWKHLVPVLKNRGSSSFQSVSSTE